MFEGVLGAAGGKTPSPAGSTSSSAFSTAAVSTNTEIDLKSSVLSTGGDIVLGERGLTAAGETPPRSTICPRKERGYGGVVKVPRTEASGGGKWLRSFRGVRLCTVNIVVSFKTGVAVLGFKQP